MGSTVVPCFVRPYPPFRNSPATSGSLEDCIKVICLCSAGQIDTKGQNTPCEYMNMCVWMQDVLRVARMPMLWDKDFWYPTAWLFSSKPLPGSSLGPLEGHSAQLQWFPSIHQVGTCRRNALRGEKGPNPSTHTTSHDGRPPACFTATSIELRVSFINKTRPLLRGASSSFLAPRCPRKVERFTQNIWQLTLF